MSFRINYLEIDRFDAADDNGVMTVEAIARHPGVLTYYKRDGSIRRELVPPELLRGFDSSGMPLAAKLAGIPVTNEHPQALFKALPSDKRDALKRGYVAEDGIEVYQDGRIKVRFHVTDAATQEDIRSGHKDGVSLGYEVGSLEKAGVWAGQRYDAAQAQPFEADHLAVVKYPRADQARITRFDAADDFAYQVFDSKEVNRPMATIRLDSGASHEVPEAVAIAWDSMHQDMKSSKKKMEEMEGEKETMQEEMDSLNETIEFINNRLDQFEKDGGTFDADAVGAVVKERVDAWMDILKATGQSVSFDSAGISFDPNMDAADIHSAFIAAVRPDIKLDGMTPDTIRGLYIGLTSSAATTDSAAPKQDAANTLQAQLQAAILSKSTPRSDARAARQAKMDAQYKRSRQPIHASA